MLRLHFSELDSQSVQRANDGTLGAAASAHSTTLSELAGAQQQD